MRVKARIRQAASTSSDEDRNLVVLEYAERIDRIMMSRSLKPFNVYVDVEIEFRFVHVCLWTRRRQQPDSVFSSCFLMIIHNKAATVKMDMQSDGEVTFDGLFTLY